MAAWYLADVGPTPDQQVSVGQPFLLYGGQCDSQHDASR